MASAHHFYFAFGFKVKFRASSAARGASTAAHIILRKKRERRSCPLILIRLYSLDARFLFRSRRGTNTVREGRPQQAIKTAVLCLFFCEVSSVVATLIGTRCLSQRRASCRTCVYVLYLGPLSSRLICSIHGCQLYGRTAAILLGFHGPWQ